MSDAASAASAPAWFIAACKEIGVREQPENRGADIRRYIALAHCGAEGQPWCAIFANAMLESVGVRGTRSPAARSFEHDANFIKLPGPALGCIVTFWRGIRSQGLGHVGFYNGEHAGLISTLGGNESDMVRVEDLASDASRFGLSGFYWPKSVRLPATGKIPPQLVSQAGSGKVV
jgi:uncharacterized protein (TIGR02594 family)